MPKKNLFQKGVPRHPNAGRRKGTPNKITRDVNAFLDSLINDVAVQEAVKLQIQNRERGAMQGFFLAVAHRKGRPKESVEISASPSLAKLLVLAAESAKAKKPEPGP